MDLRNKHNLPELSPILRNREEETAQYLQDRLNNRRQELSRHVD